MTRPPALARAGAAVLLVALLAGCDPGFPVPSSGSGRTPSAPVTPKPTFTTTRQALTGTVRWVVDGDTFDLRDKQKRTHRVRLLGIDAPELAHDGVKAQCGATKAKRALAGLLPAGISVVVVFDARAGDHDRFGRDLGYARTTSLDDVGLRMIRLGMVESWSPAGSRAPTRRATYDAAEAKAKQSKTGLWSACGMIGR